MKFSFLLCVAACMVSSLAAQTVRVADGLLKGSTNSSTQVQIFKGIPFAAPPIGPLRWKAPQPVHPWTGVRNASEFGARCMQAPVFADMIFRDSGPSEDCLYLNVWSPAKQGAAKLPVMVWIYGGGFQAGASSEPRQDGERLATKGVVVVSMNYRLGVFGFLSHPELTAESAHKASGNYGLMDQTAALSWVKKNIAAFGGDPGNVTIFGESAGSMSVSAQMASPLASGLFERAIGESGSVFMMDPFPALAVAETRGKRFTEEIGAKDLSNLRAKSAQEVLNASRKDQMLRFWPCVDGYFFPEPPTEIYKAGKQAHVALMAGWNTDEQSANAFFHGADVTPAAFEAKVRQQYGADAEAVLRAYPHADAAEAKSSGRDLAGDQFIAYSTWKWLDMQNETGDAPVYRYHFEQEPPPVAGEEGHGAYHSADIQYVFEALDSAKNPWSQADRKLSDVISSYWTNFAKNGDPNGSGLPNWPRYTKADRYPVMHLREGAAEEPHAAPDDSRNHDEALDQALQNRRRTVQ